MTVSILLSNLEYSDYENSQYKVINFSIWRVFCFRHINQTFRIPGSRDFIERGAIEPQKKPGRAPMSGIVKSIWPHAVIALRSCGGCIQPFPDQSSDDPKVPPLSRRPACGPPGRFQSDQPTRRPCRLTAFAAL